jgi:hypothetical protein
VTSSAMSLVDAACTAEHLLKNLGSPTVHLTETQRAILARELRRLHTLGRLSMKRQIARALEMKCREDY